MQLGKPFASLMPSRGALPASPDSVRLCRPPPGIRCSLNFLTFLQEGPASFPGHRAALPPAAGNSLLFRFLSRFSPGGPCQLPRSACGHAARRRELPALTSVPNEKNIFIYISYIYISIYIYPFSTVAVSFLRSLLSELRQTSQATRKLAGVAPEHLSPCFSSHAVSFQQSC